MGGIEKMHFVGIPHAIIWKLDGMQRAGGVGGPWGLVRLKSSHCNPQISQSVNPRSPVLYKGTGLGKSRDDSTLQGSRVVITVSPRSYSRNEDMIHPQMLPQHARGPDM